MTDIVASPERVRAKIADWKDALLDLTTRNPLVALPEEGQVDLPAPNDVFEPLLRRRKPLTFWDLSNRSLDRTVLRDYGNYPVRSAAWNTFRHLHLQALSLLQGQDVNALYVVFGVLAWTDATGHTTRSPLLMVPVMLERNAEGTAYVITRSQEEDVEVNPVLTHRLGLADVGLHLPSAPEEAYLIPSAYLRMVGELIAEREGWEVEERSCLGLFPLLKMRLYEDLVVQERRAEQHPLVAALAGDREAIRALPLVASPSLGEVGEGSADAEQFLLLDADPAQQRAVVAAARGQSFVLQGPPGTGKTQTITNIISECVAAGKSVLLVSGRMASLDAVLRRLSDKGLGDLCLAAHSLKTSKRDILAQLEQSLTGPARSAGIAKTSKKDLETLDALRHDLDLFARALHEPRPDLGLSVYEANGIVADSDEHVRRRRAQPLSFDITAPESVSPSDYVAMEAVVRDLAGHQAFSAATGGGVIWNGAFTDAARAGLAADVEAGLDAVLAGLDQVDASAPPLARSFGLGAPATPNDVSWLLRFAEQIAAAPRLSAHWLQEDAAALVAAASRVAAFQARLDHVQSSAVSSPAVAAEELSVDPDALKDRLTVRAEQLLLPLLGEGWQEDAVVNATPLRDVLAHMGLDARNLFEAFEFLAQRCGVDLDESFEGKQRVLRVAQRATEVTGATTTWFNPGTIIHLLQLLEQARAQWGRCSRLRDDLLSAYSEQILDLDHSSLLESLRSQPTGFGRLLNPVGMRAQAQVKATLLPKANARDRDLSRDLESAQQLKELIRWTQFHEPALSSSFNSQYRGGDTDWDRIRESLLKADAVCGEFVNEETGRVPPSLIASIVVGGAEMDRLREKQQAIAGLFASLRSHWDELSRRVQLASLPEPQSSLNDIASWCDSRIQALDEYNAAYAEIRAACPLIAVNDNPGREAADTHAAQTFVPVEALLEGLHATRRLSEERTVLAAEREELRTVCGDLFAGEGTDWEGIRQGLSAAATLLRLMTAPEAALRTLPSDIEELLSAAEGIALLQGDIEPARHSLQHAVEGLEASLNTLTALFCPDYFRVAGQETPESASLAALREWMVARRNATGEIERSLPGQELRGRCAAVGLGSFFDSLAEAVAQGRTDVRDPETLLALFRARFHRIWGGAVAEHEPVLQGFTGEEHEKGIDRFRELDRRYLESAPGRIRETTKTRAPKQFVDEVKTLKAQLARRRTGEIRKLLAQIPNLLFALKPCVMMNPLSVRLFLDADAVRFDVVLFDDASQIATEDAVGAILRGRQVIVAGDPKQLPPLSLINATAGGVGGPAAAPSGAFESVLDAAGSVVSDGDASDHFARYTLNWHYRSQNEALIAFSRRFFYPSLMSFPSAQVSAGAIRYLPVADGKDESGPSHSTERVVDVVLDYKRHFPTRSVGVITLTEGDYARLLDAFTRRREEDPESFAPLLTDLSDGAENGGGPEAFFIKMIENVQGDERDIIVLHVGPEPSSFTPLLEPGSDRLLNVATTRARCDMVVVSALPPGASTVPNADRTSGLHLLHAFLEYARDPTALLAASAAERTIDERGDAFASTLGRALADRGYDVREQIGLSDYRVDLAVVDAAHPDRYLLGIECDGPTYVATRTARHRDRLCPEMLTQRGWNLCRVWSLEWNRNPQTQVRRIVRAVDAAKAAMEGRQ